MKDPELFILIPVDNHIIARQFYLEILQFQEINSCMYFPFEYCRNVQVLLINADEESKKRNIMLQTNEIRFPIARYFLPKNFPTYCKKLYESKVKFNQLLLIPGGYFAEISDPFGNSFEIWCDDFEDSNNTDLTEIDIYRRV